MSRRLRRTTAALALALLLAGGAAHALPLEARSSPLLSGPALLLDLLETWLAALRPQHRPDALSGLSAIWQEEGSIMDPNGRCADAGSIMDPNGGCAGLQGDEGGIMDPDG